MSLATSLFVSLHAPDLERIYTAEAPLKVLSCTMTILTIDLDRNSCNNIYYRCVSLSSITKGVWVGRVAHPWKVWGKILKEGGKEEKGKEEGKRGREMEKEEERIKHALLTQEYQVLKQLEHFNLKLGL